MSGLTEKQIAEICGHARKVSGALAVVMIFPGIDDMSCRSSFCRPRGSGVVMAKVLRELAAQCELDENGRELEEIKQPPQPGAAAT